MWFCGCAGRRNGAEDRSMFHLRGVGIEEREGEKGRVGFACGLGSEGSPMWEMMKIFETAFGSLFF